jgi:hypothetical protein
MTYVPIMKDTNGIHPLSLILNNYIKHGQLVMLVLQLKTLPGMTQLQSHLHMIHLAPPGLQVQDSAQHI